MIAQTPNYLRKICKEYEQVENYAEAVADETQMWIMHHRKEIDEGKSAKELDDEGNYINVPPEDLIFITWSEHTILHNTGNQNMLGKHHSAETKRKMSEAQKGEKHPLYGKHHTAETRKKISEAQKGEKHPHFGTHWWNNGEVNIRSKDCPEGFVRGRVKK